MGVGAECWACVMHVSCAVSPCVDCGACTVVQLCHLSVCCVACCLLCRLWVHALRCLIYIYFYLYCNTAWLSTDHRIAFSSLSPPPSELVEVSSSVPVALVIKVVVQGS